MVVQHEGVPAGAQPIILVVDDAKENLTLIGKVLQPYYRVRVASGGLKALDIASTVPRPDLILLDVMMPDMDGYAVLTELKARPVTHDIPVIFVTSLDADEDEERGLSLGAIDYITKPIHSSILLARVSTHLALKHSRDQLKTQNQRLEARVLERTLALKVALERAEAAHAGLRKTYFGVLRAFGELAELRGGHVGRHSQRVAELARQVALQVGMSDAEIQDVFAAALLHDIGMIGFSDSLFRKPVGKLSGEDLQLYRQHPEIGAGLVAKIDGMTGVAEIIAGHHEHYDGSGFPNGLSGLEIPFGARIIGPISDYDALKHGRLTAQHQSPKQSFNYLLEQRGKRYDPMVVDILEPMLAGDENFEIDESRIEAHHLQQGMVLSREIRHPDGFLLLSAGTVMIRRTIDQLVDVEKCSGAPLDIYVHRQRIGD